MKTIKVSEATPSQLDWLVAKCESSDGRLVKLGGGWNGAFYVELENGPDSGGFHRFDPANDWAQGGPIVEKELINLITTAGYPWRATMYMGGGVWIDQHGPTPLIAAMRCYVCSVMGEIAEIPEELE